MCVFLFANFSRIFAMNMIFVALDELRSFNMCMCVCVRFWLRQMNFATHFSFVGYITIEQHFVFVCFDCFSEARLQHVSSFPHLPLSFSIFLRCCLSPKKLDVFKCNRRCLFRFYFFLLILGMCVVIFIWRIVFWRSFLFELHIFISFPFNICHRIVCIFRMNEWTTSTMYINVFHCRATTTTTTSDQSVLRNCNFYYYECTQYTRFLTP